MYQINDVVVYKSNGVCKIEDIGIPDFVSSEETYYQIRPFYEQGGKIYVKISNGDTVLRPTITKEEAIQDLYNLKNEEGIYHSNDKVREREYTAIIQSCNFWKCLLMMKGILLESDRREAAGKHLNMTDERCLQRVKKLLNAEYSIACNVSLEHAKEAMELAFTEADK